MSKIISIHSFRGGTGKSNTTANVATLMAAQGLRVGVIDTDIQSPGIHILFRLEEDDMKFSLNDYLWGKCEIKDCAHDVSGNLNGEIKGKVYLIPSSIKAGEIARVLREGYDVEETLLSIAISDALAIIMRPDQQDFQGTGVTVEVARKLDVPRMVIVVNKVPEVFDTEDVKKRVEQTYGCEVAAVMPHSDEMMALASSGVFARKYPDHPITTLYQQVANILLS
jgi:septum site-determining protein MinD